MFFESEHKLRRCNGQLFLNIVINDLFRLVNNLTLSHLAINRLEHLIGNLNDLIGADISGNGENHIVKIIEIVVTAVKHFRRDLSD